jgi:hypothetical protein
MKPLSHHTFKKSTALTDCLKNSRNLSPQRSDAFGHRLLGLLLCCMLGSLSFSAAQEAAASTPESGVAALRQELSEAVKADSAAAARRVCKSVIRKAQALLATTPEGGGRFALLGLIQDGQRRLLSLENTLENRNDLFATAEELRKAPDEFAELRLDADLLLMEKTMSEKKATPEERCKVLEELLAKYRGTAAESKGLMIGSMIAAKLVDLELVARIKERIYEISAGDLKTIQQWRTDNASDRFDAVFRGTFQIAGGASVSLPLDRWGRPYLVFFWSEQTPRIDDHLKEAKALQAASPGGLEVLSFNVDELPDAGREKLKKLGLDWTVMQLPGGRKNPTYQAYASIDPQAFIVNAQGRVLLESPSPALGIAAAEGAGEEIPGPRKIADFSWQIDDSRYLAQLRSLFIGDFLVADAPASSSLPAEVAPPFRYRISREEELAHYRKVADLTTSALKSKADAPDSWQLRNRRIIALIGLWNLTGDASHLDAAATEAGLVLGMTALPPGADVVSRFCRVKVALRKGEENPEALIANFIAQCGGEKASASALAAAAMLALDANARSVHETYRKRLLALGDAIDPGLWPVRAFLLDRHHRHRNFYALPGGLKERMGKAGFRVMLSGLDEPLDRNTRLSLELKSLNGGTMTLPQEKPDRMLGVIFAEPSADAATQAGMMDRVKAFAKAFKNHDDVDVVVAMLSDDAKLANAAVPEDKSYQVAMVPGGLKNPLVRKLGILSADIMPNVILFRNDGTLAWAVSGLSYRYSLKAEGPDFPMVLAIANNLQKLKSDVGFESLERGDYETAVQQFNAFTTKNAKENWWHSDRTHGRALAQMGLKDWEAALITIDDAIKQRMVAGRCKCHGVVEILLTKAMILDQLKRGDEAKAARAMADQETQPHPTLPSGAAFKVGIAGGVYYDRLKRVRLAMEAPKLDKD